MNFTFSQPLWFSALLLIPVFWLFLRRRGKVGLTHLNGLSNGFGSRFLLILPKIIFSLAFIALVAALARPQRVYYEADDSLNSRDIVITVDKSGSMSSPVSGDMPPHSAPETDLDRDFPGMPTSVVNAPPAMFPQSVVDAMAAVTVAVTTTLPTPIR